jgi:single-stranded DNA-specific DHH superfamily exonuclease
MGPEVKEEDFQDVGIIKGLYTVLEEVAELDSECQVIVVDNHPPQYADKYVIVRYTRDPEKYPYGFISDEVR